MSQTRFWYHLRWQNFISTNVFMWSIEECTQLAMNIVPSQAPHVVLRAECRGWPTAGTWIHCPHLTAFG